MLAFSRVSLGDGSAVSCRRCAAPASATAVYRPAGEVTAAIVAALASAPGSGILLSGPEAFAHPSLPTLVGAALKAGVGRLGVTTSAAALAHGDNAPGSVAAGLRLIEVPILGVSPETHDFLAGSPGAFEATRVGVERFKAAAAPAGAHVAVRGRIDVCAHTVGALPAIVVVLAQWGVSSIELRCSGALDSRGIEQVLAACETGTVNAVWVVVTGVDSALLGQDALHATDVLAFSGVNV